MKCILSISLLLLASVSLFAQTTTERIQSEETIKVSKKKKRYQYFSGSAPVTMADGSVKPIADVKIGEHVKTCKGGKSTITQVKQINVFTEPYSSLTAIYLRPADEPESIDRKIVPALLLEATPDHRVQTKHGKKRMRKLSKNDILYHYEPATDLVSSWKVGAVKENARRVSKAYHLETVDGTYLVENVMVANN
jgi:ribosomal 50S subunit-recycling heat shock protein